MSNKTSLSVVENTEATNHLIHFLLCENKQDVLASKVCIQKYITDGAAINGSHSYFATRLPALHSAIESDCSTEILRFLISKGAEIIGEQPGDTVLHTALKFERLSALKFFLLPSPHLDTKALLSSTDRQGRTPLMLAAEFLNTDAVVLLIPMDDKGIKKALEHNKHCRAPNLLPGEKAIVRKIDALLQRALSKNTSTVNTASNTHLMLVTKERHPFFAAKTHDKSDATPSGWIYTL